MKFDEIRRQLERFAEASVHGDDGDVVFRMETSIRGAGTLEELATMVDNTPGAELAVTGDGSRDAVVLVRIPCDSLKRLPPYLEDEV